MLQSTDNDGIAEAAERLWNARKSNLPCAPIRSLLKGGVEAPYAVQKVNTRRSLAEGRRLVGRKIGLTSPAVQEHLGVDQPDFGMLFGDVASIAGTTNSVARRTWAVVAHSSAGSAPRMARTHLARCNLRGQRLVAKAPGRTGVPDDHAITVGSCATHRAGRLPELHPVRRSPARRAPRTPFRSPDAGVAQAAADTQTPMALSGPARAAIELTSWSIPSLGITALSRTDRSLVPTR